MKKFKRIKSIFTEVTKKSWEDLSLMTYAESIKFIASQNSYSSETKDLYPKLTWGNGSFEKWFEQTGRKITANDIKDLLKKSNGIEDIASLLSNIFYNGVSLTKAMDDKALKTAIDAVYSKGDDDMKAYTFIYAQDYKGPRKKMAQYMKSLDVDVSDR